jgi:hypothetical protein
MAHKKNEMLILRRWQIILDTIGGGGGYLSSISAMKENKRRKNVSTYYHDGFPIQARSSF